MFHELTAKQLTEQRRQELEPSRALYSSFSSSAITIPPVKEASQERPILCDDCGSRAGAIGSLIFFCPQCKIVIKVAPHLGRVEFTLEQYADTLAPNQFDLDRMTAASEESSKLDPLNPADY